MILILSKLPTFNYHRHNYKIDNCVVVTNYKYWFATLFNKNTNWTINFAFLIKNFIFSRGFE